MGLTIHYGLTTDLGETADIRRLIEAVRQFAVDLPLESVGEVIEFTADDDEPRDETEHWLRIQSETYVQVDDSHYPVPPTHGIAFSTRPGAGCEAANFGFCTYPALLDIEGERISTGRRGWSWSSFCKTQYASNPNCGGVQHFLRCHLAVIKILDFFQTTGLTEVEVGDDGGYWKRRDLQALVHEVGKWNELIAGFAGELKDALGPNLEAAITAFANFEHLEAKGLERLSDLRRKKP